MRQRGFHRRGELREDRVKLFEGISFFEEYDPLKSTMRMPTRTGEILIIARRVMNGSEILMNEVISLISMGCYLCLMLILYLPS